MTLPVVFNHLWQSTLFAGLAAVLTLAFRKNRAQMRYWVWLSASVKFLIPFSLLIGVGSQVDWRATPPLAPVVEQIAQPFAVPVADVTAMPAERVIPWSGLSLWLCLWLIGCASVLVRWWLRWRRVRMAVRTASALAIGAPIPIMSSRTRMEPGVFGVFRPVLLLPEGIAERLTPAQFRAVLAHEFCHVRRRDNLTAALHMVVEAAFWFHPLVWWIGARLVEERERACDEEVLRMGSDPVDYAAGILKVCRLYLESPLACASGVTGADLKKRVQDIMTQGVRMRITFAKKLLLAAAGMAAVAVPIWIGVGRGQSQGAAPLRFEVASIKPVRGLGGKGGLETLPGGGLRMGGVTMLQLITLAYDVRETQVTGAPPWADSAIYDILAKPEHPDAIDNRLVAPGTAAWMRLQQRIQSLLAERFQLVIHKTSKEAQVYALVPVKGGAKLQPLPEGNAGPPRTMRSAGKIEAHNGTMHMLAAVLSNWLGRTVVDRTGLAGTYDYKLEYAQEPGGRGAPMEAPGEASPAGTSGPSVFTALQEQFGLKLESQKGAVETIVIDRAQKPSAN